MDNINHGVLKGAIFQALKQTKRGIYLRSYANRVANRAIEIYTDRINEIKKSK